MIECFENRKYYRSRKRRQIAFSAFMLEVLTKAISLPFSKGKISELRSLFFVLFRKALWVEFLRFRVIMRIVMNAVHRDVDSNS